MNVSIATGEIRGLARRKKRGKKKLLVGSEVLVGPSGLSE